jgi:general stress protein YciG
MNREGSEQKEKRKSGFASMDPEKQRAIAVKDGKACHAKGTAHTFTREEASAAGEKGGAVVSRDRAHMAEIGRKGGRIRGKRARARRADREMFEDGAEATSGEAS